MLPKKNRADRRDVEKIFKEGRFFSSPNLNFKFLIKKAFPTQVSFIVPKTVSKKAVERNKLRRLGYLILEKYINKSSVPLLGAFVYRKKQDDISILENEIKNTFNKIN